METRVPLFILVIPNDVNSASRSPRSRLAVKELNGSNPFFSPTEKFTPQEIKPSKALAVTFKGTLI